MALEPLEFGNMDAAPIGIVMGKTGMRKSTLIAQACPTYLWVESSKTGLRCYEAMCNANESLTKIKKVLFIKDDGDLCNEMMYVIEHWIQDWHQRYDGIVWDEFSTFLASAQKIYSGKNLFDTIRNVKGLADSVKLCNTETNKPCILICHTSEAKFHEQENPEISEYIDELENKIVRLKYVGGPSFPYGTMIQPFVQDMTFCVELVTLPDGSSKWLTDSEKFVARKLRTDERLSGFKGTFAELMKKAKIKI
jgi:hypothetical protein